MVKNTFKIESLITWVYTEKLELTCDFYKNGIGLHMLRDEGPAKIFDVGNGGQLGICQAFEDRVVEPKGGMITFVTNNVDTWFTHLSSKGIKLDSTPHVLEKFKIYTFFLRDPNGYQLEFQQFLD